MNRFATRPMFDIDGLDWLTATLTAKTTKLTATDTPATTPKDNETWEDRCACIGMMNEPANALCSMLVWGYDSQQCEKVVHYLSKILQRQKIKLPNNCPHSPAELCDKIANMVLYLHFWDLWECFTVKGKLQCGEMFGWGAIQIHERTYSKQYYPYQKLAIQKLQELLCEIEDNIKQYRKNLILFEREPTNSP
ncbi:hypothetical protein [Faucicola boevrei]|uniref:hypothetical protein n=1 Tax=Faucicola boevrei TaxID=346665 RepID=UPI00037AEAFB|nr:hypothetical protein [Moraxella boevrei]